MIARALLSVSDKTGLADFAKALRKHGVEIVSTGGTAKLLREAGIAVTEVAEITGLPEMMDGRVKTLHPKIHGGLLAVRENEAHLKALAEHAIKPIDLLAANLYPFEQTVAGGADFATCDRDHRHRRPGHDPRRGQEPRRRHGGGRSRRLRRACWPRWTPMAAPPRSPCANSSPPAPSPAPPQYDAAIASWFAGQLGETTPNTMTIAGRLAEALRYGENPHQWAAFYRTGERRFGVATARQVQGKELSYNNLNDTDAAYELAAEFDPKASAAVAIVKHANPCGVAIAGTLAEAYRKALACDPTSAFGGIVAANRKLDAEAAREIVKIFTEVIIAPDASDEARAIVAEKKNLRLLLAGGLPDPSAPGLAFRSLAGGFLVQSRDDGVVADGALKVVTKRQPTKQELADLLFAFTVAKHVKSNAIVYARAGATVGIGAGQMSRVDAARMAAWKAADAARAQGLERSLTEGAVAASDAFFPFADGLKAIAEAGATAVIQPGGSLRDDEVIAAADAAGLAMVFTGLRHFRH